MLSMKDVGPNITQKELLSIIHEVGVDENGLINYAELVDILIV